MFTAELLGGTIDKQTRTRIVTVQFTDGKQEFVKDFTFNVDAEVTLIKQVIKDFLTDINAVPEELDGDFSVGLPQPSPAQLEKEAWEIDFAKLEKVKRLIDCGVLVGTEPQIVTLRNKVRADFKVSFL